jgi:3-hydroxybutyryl-CoA dehydrogenase
MDKIVIAETIDSAMKLEANHPLESLALADLIGIDVCLNIMKELQCKLNDQRNARALEKTGRGLLGPSH